MTIQEAQTFLNEYNTVFSALNEIEVKGNNVDMMYSIKTFLKNRISAITEQINTANNESNKDSDNEGNIKNAEKRK